MRYWSFFRENKLQQKSITIHNSWRQVGYVKGDCRWFNRRRNIGYDLRQYKMLERECSQNVHSDFLVRKSPITCHWWERSVQ